MKLIILVTILLSTPNFAFANDSEECLVGKPWFNPKVEKNFSDIEYHSSKFAVIKYCEKSINTKTTYSFTGAWKPCLCGMKYSGKKTVDGFQQLLLHPIDSVVSFAKAIYNLDDLIPIIYEKVEEQIKSQKHLTFEQKKAVNCAILTSVLEAVIGTKGLTKLGKLSYAKIDNIVKAKIAEYVDIAIDPSLLEKFHKLYGSSSAPQSGLVMGQGTVFYRNGVQLGLYTSDADLFLSLPKSLENIDINQLLAYASQYGTGSTNFRRFADISTKINKHTGATEIRFKIKGEWMDSYPEKDMVELLHRIVSQL